MKACAESMMMGGVEREDIREIADLVWFLKWMCVSELRAS